jgi:hypothetical protein
VLFLALALREDWVITQCMALMLWLDGMMMMIMMTTYGEDHATCTVACKPAEPE